MVDGGVRSRRTNIPAGFMTKYEAAERLGLSTKTLDRRRKSEPLLQQTLRKGNQVLFREAVIQRYFALCEQRGHL